MNLKKYNSIDLVKIFMAVCVVAIHTEPLYYCSNALANNVFKAVGGGSGTVFLYRLRFLNG